MREKKTKVVCKLFYFMNNILLTLIHEGFLLSW